MIIFLFSMIDVIAGISFLLVLKNMALTFTMVAFTILLLKGIFTASTSVTNSPFFFLLGCVDMFCSVAGFLVINNYLIGIARACGLILFAKGMLSVLPSLFK